MPRLRKAAGASPVPYLNGERMTALVRATCPGCGQPRQVTVAGVFRRHRRGGITCPGALDSSLPSPSLRPHPTGAHPGSPDHSRPKNPPTAAPVTAAVATASPLAGASTGASANGCPSAASTWRARPDAPASTTPRTSHDRPRPAPPGRQPRHRAGLRHAAPLPCPQGRPVRGWPARALKSRGSGPGGVQA